jgi:hypothetical protein
MSDGKSIIAGTRPLATFSRFSIRTQDRRAVTQTIPISASKAASLIVMFGVWTTRCDVSKRRVCALGSSRCRAGVIEAPVLRIVGEIKRCAPAARHGFDQRNGIIQVSAAHIDLLGAIAPVAAERTDAGLARTNVAGGRSVHGMVVQASWSTRDSVPNRRLRRRCGTARLRTVRSYCQTSCSAPVFRPSANRTRTYADRAGRMWPPSRQSWN